MIATRKPDPVTKRWMRDESDELAFHNGCWMDEAKGEFVISWMEDYLRLYEGVWAGQPFISSDWQYEFHMRLYGWCRPNVEWPELGRDWMRRFRTAIVFIAKKNKKSPTLAANSIYKTHGDDVQGEKMFLCAKDGAQVRQNVATHVIKMIEASPELLAESKINRNEMTIEHLPTNSKIIPLSSSNERTEKSKEGLNGSRGVDEVHVVDKRFIGRIDRSDISRPEPINLELSTVGKDIDSYGYERFKYAEGVIDGSIIDDTTLAMIFAAPQDLSDEELAKDPVKYGKMANPAWGHTVKESEFLADYNRSRQTLRGLADFKMYRLNIWQASASPWLDMAAWDQCDQLVEFNQSRCTYGGLDLSSKMDFTGWRIVQKQGDVWVTTGHSWISEYRAKAHSDMGLAVFDWADQGYLTICDGERIDYSEVTDRVLADFAKHDIATVGFDPWQAEAVIQLLASEGVEMVEMPQTYAHMSDPSKELEASVAAHDIAHGGDPCLRWMAKNCTTRADKKDNIFPEKPERSSMKAIDGITALVMAIGQGILSQEPAASVFDTEWNF